jgi:tetratricopeptide (TPR) repeat protein
LKLNYLEEFLSLVDVIFSKANRKCYLIIDALNEYSGNINDLIKSIENIIAQAANYSWFKVIVSIRDSAYSRTLAKFGEIVPNQYFKVEEEKAGEKISSNVVRLKPVAKNFTEQLFNAYRDFKWKESGNSNDEGIYIYRPLTNFNELDPNGSTIELLRNPLMTRLILQSFHRSKLPSQLKNDEAMKLYLDNIILEKSSDSAGFPERNKLLKLFVRQLDSLNSERIERERLIKMDSFKTYLINTQKDSPYIQLLELGVLMEEWDKDDCFVRFAFDRFFEFMLAELHYSKINNAIDVKNICNRISEFKILQGAIEIIVLRFCNNEQTDILVELSDLTDNEPLEIQILITEMIANILFSLSIENYNQFEYVIKTFPEKPGETDLNILILLLEKFYKTGSLENFKDTMIIAKQEASFLKNNKILSDLLLFESGLDMLQGRYIEAREKIGFAITEKKVLNDIFGLCQAIRKLGVLEWRLGNNTESMKNFILCLELSNKNNFKDISAMMKNNLGVLYKEQGEITEAERLYQESLEIKRQLGDKEGIATSLNNLGIIYKDQGKIAEAEILYQESLEFRRQLGNKDGIAKSLNNLGTLYNEQGEIAEAERFFLESLELRRHLGDKQGVASSLNNLGGIYLVQGKIDDAEILFQESLELRRQLENKKEISSSLDKLGFLNFEKGELENAKLFYLESILLKIELNDTPGIIAAIHRTFSLMNDSERETYFTLSHSLINESTKTNQQSQMANIELMYYCLSNKKVESEILNEKKLDVLRQKEKSTLSDLDDLPIEAFYCAALKSIEIGNEELAKEFAGYALNMIGESRSIRKEYFEKISQ